MNLQTKDRLTKILIAEIGCKKVITDQDILEKYSRDETSDLESRPDILVRAESAEDVQKTLSICDRHEIPVTPRGAGTGVTGGSVPVRGGVVLCLEKMDRVVEIDTENMVAVVEPGAITADIQKAAHAHGLMYPPDPASVESCSIGGNVAENAGGPSAVKYGTTKDYVLGLEFVLPGGCLMRAGGKTVKNATGYNLCGIVLGSEGTLAVITKIVLRLIPAPNVVRDILIPFETIDSAIDAVTGILGKRIVPAAIEFMEKDAIRLVAKYFPDVVQFSDAEAHLLIRMDGFSEEGVFNEMMALAKAVDVDQQKIYIAESAMQKERMWRARRSIRDSLSKESPVFLAEDCVVPRARIPIFLKGLKKRFKARRLTSLMFGHAGDGNVHIDVLKKDIPYETWRSMLPDIKKEIYANALALGGTITGEHGIGFIRRDYLDLALTKEEIDLSQRIKNAFDPNGVLNPGKIFKISEK